MSQLREFLRSPEGLGIVILIVVMGFAGFVSVAVAGWLALNIPTITEPPFEVIGSYETDHGETCPGEVVEAPVSILVQRPTTLLVAFNVWDRDNSEILEAEHDPIWLILDGEQKRPSLIEETLRYRVPEGLKPGHYELRISGTDYITTVPSPIFKIAFEVSATCNQ